jgi:multicomponent Na+:H+ antiporter subunit E
LLKNIILFLLLFGSWLIFSGYFSTFFVMAGIFSCALAVLISAKISVINKEKREGSLIHVLLNFPLYLVWLIKEVVISGVTVSSKMWQVEPEISPQIAWIPTNVRDNLGLTIFGNSITITPGTVTLDVRNEGMIYVHALTAGGIDDLRGGAMGNKVQKLTGL